MINYNDMFQHKKGTAVNRLTDSLKYVGTGNGSSIRVAAEDLRELINFYETFHSEDSHRQMDLDLRSDPEIVNIPEGINKELNIKRIINFRDNIK
jgi:hypothetical protein